MQDVLIRPFRQEDTAATTQIFYDAVHRGTRAHYDAGQRQAWAPRLPDGEAWFARLDAQTAFVAERNGDILGFMSIAADGCIDLAFVAPAQTGQGIGQRLYDAILSAATDAGLCRLHTQASHPARAFFERQGWSVVTPQTVVRDGVSLPNFVMERILTRLADGRPSPVAPTK